MSVGLIVGAGGIGAEVARMAHQSVDHTLVFDRDPDKVQRLREELACVGVVGDIASGPARRAVVDKLHGLGQALEWVVLSSGVGLRSEVANLTPEVLRSAFEVNVVAPVLLIGELLREAEWATEARVVGVGSISARRALPGRTAYGATKAAFEAFLTALGVEVAERGIRVNVVCPGVTDTDFIKPSRAQLEEWARQRVPAGRMGEPSEVASVIAYLIMGAPSYLTCSRIVVDGGTEAMP